MSSTSNFPVTLDVFNSPVPATPMDGNGDSTLSHSYQHTHLNDAVSALQKLIGTNGTQDQNSILYKIANGVGPTGPTGPQGQIGLQGIPGPVGPTGPGSNNGNFTWTKVYDGAGGTKVDVHGNFGPGIYYAILTSDTKPDTSDLYYTTWTSKTGFLYPFICVPDGSFNAQLTFAETGGNVSNTTTGFSQQYSQYAGSTTIQIRSINGAYGNLYGGNYAIYKLFKSA